MATAISVPISALSTTCGGDGAAVTVGGASTDFEGTGSEEGAVLGADPAPLPFGAEDAVDCVVPREDAVVDGDGWAVGTAVGARPADDVPCGATVSGGAPSGS